MLRFAIERPVIVSVALLILCLLGVLAMFRVPVQMIPDLDPRLISVRTTWPGATPQDVEKEILIEQEDYLRKIPGLERMTSRAMTGSADIELEFPHGTDINEALIRVNNALAQVPSYPENVDEPTLVTNSISDSAFMYFRIVPLPGNPKQVDMMMMRDFIDDHVRTQVERVRGVSEVNLWSGAERQIKIFVDPARLAERGITVTQVRDAIRARNRDLSGGDIDAGKRRYLLRTVGRFESVEEIEELIVARRGDSLTRLRDVGSAELGHFEIRNVSYTNGEPNITLGVRRQVGANVVQIKDAVMDKVAVLNAGLLRDQGLIMELNSEDVRYVEEAIQNVRRNLAIGAGLATLVLYLFLRSGTATLVGAVGIPVCVIAAFLGLLLAGRTINVISLAGIAFAIGMTLDNGIVVLENVYRHAALGKARAAAALDGVREVWPAVLASTLTTVFVFIPIVFVREEAGQLYSDIAIAISASILTSMLVATTLVPAACARFVGKTAATANERALLNRFGAWFARLTMGFVDWLLASVLRRLVLVAAVLGLTFAVIEELTPKAEYLPEGEEQKIFAFMFAPPGYNLEEMHRVLLDLNEFFVPHIGGDPQLYARGQSAVPALNSMIAYAQPHMIITIIEATERAQTNDLLEIAARRFREEPGMLAFASRGSIFQSNFGGTRSINLDISGPQLAPLYAAGLAAFKRAHEVFDEPQVRPEPPSLTLGQPLIEVRPDWERAAELGFTARDLGYTIWALADGAFVDEFYFGDDKIDVFLYGTGGNVAQPQDLEKLLIYAPNGAVVPLSAVAAVRETVNTDTIRRVDGERTITLSIIPPRNIALETGVEIVEREIIRGLADAGRIPPGVRMQITGASDRLAATREALSGNFLVAVLIAYLLMVAIFSHWGYPMIILATVPVGLSGGILGLWLFNFAGAHADLVGLAPLRQPFDVITMLGFLVLIGTVVNNPILIVEQSLINMREHAMASAEAVRAATRARLRPIMMTTITTVCGLGPLVFNPGAGTELYRGLGAVVLFGLLFSTLITLTFMPSVLSLALEVRDHLRGRRRRGDAPLSA
ncbi:MAG: efflux RND transporter permease subunit [Gammaproteobacteria bacterium]|nr:efflux RND transporter permease subunit [Gammaproteobacteria bacterium]